MYKVVVSSRFRKDYIRVTKRGYNLDLIGKVVAILEAGEALPSEYRDHKLVGDYAGSRECHITSDWLLIYEIDEAQSIVYLARTGTHSDLF